jgi:hypothetical protein
VSSERRRSPECGAAGETRRFRTFPPSPPNVELRPTEALHDLAGGGSGLSGADIRICQWSDKESFRGPVEPDNAITICQAIRRSSASDRRALGRRLRPLQSVRCGGLLRELSLIRSKSTGLVRNSQAWSIDGTRASRPNHSCQAAANAVRASSIHPVAFISSNSLRARSINARSSCALSPRRKRP